MSPSGRNKSPEKIANKILRLQERAEIQLVSYDPLSLALNSSFGLLVARVEVLPGFIQTKEHADFFEELSRDRDPMAQCLVGIVISAENSSGFTRGPAATSFQYLG